jgi:hypothetical protein
LSDLETTEVTKNTATNNLVVSGVGQMVDQIRVGSTYCCVPIKLISPSLTFFVQSNSNPITVKTLTVITSVIQLPKF